MNITDYKKAKEALPDKYEAWEIHGAGFDQVGKNGKPSTLELREPKDNEIVLRVDALGLCQSDIKIINQGSKHARLRGRDLSQEPTVLGHECAATVVKVGKQWQDQFQIGERFIVQADIYYKGLGFAFGYLIPGGLAEYCYLDERALAGDEGCYLLPVKPDTGYSQAALSEPWACVEMSYNLDDRREPLADGACLIVADQPGSLTQRCPQATVIPQSLAGLPEGEFDDIIVTQPTPAVVGALAPRLKKNGVMFLLGQPAETGPTALDIGRIHYENIRFYGGGDTLEAVEKANERMDLLPGGAAVFIGAGGPMGQMHVQRACEMRNGPGLVVVTDLDRERLDHIETRFGGLAQGNKVELKTFAPSQFESQAAMDAHILGLTEKGYSDVIIMAPVVKLVPSSLAFAADNCLVNVFAGVGVGSEAPVNVEDLCRGVKLIGSSGSRISDLRKVLQKVEDGELNTNLSVAAIGGLSSAREGLEGVRDARFPGKTVIYTQIPELPLMPLEEVAAKIPELKDKLGPNSTWTKEAEEALIAHYVPEAKS